MNEDKTVRIVEGKTTLFVPKSSLDTRVPSKLPAFFNPLGRLARDFSILVYNSITIDRSESESGGISMADSLAGVGARGIRVAVEVPNIDVVYLNDLNPTAIKYARKSAEYNNVLQKCRFSVKDACVFLIEHSAPSERFHIIDIDPFGSPSPFLDCGLRAIKDGGLISITATDTAVLCGVYPKVSFRKYYGWSLRTEYCHEIAIRLLYGSLAYCAIRLDCGIQPLFCHTTVHYNRIYAYIYYSKGSAEETASNLGYIAHCFKCGDRCVSSTPITHCKNCGANKRLAGPLWIGKIYDRQILDRVLNLSEQLGMKGCMKIVKMAIEEIDSPPTYYITDRLCNEIGVASISPSKLVDELKSRGFNASRTAMNPKGVKTDAPISVLKEVIKSLS
ncbi:MAG: tRNA (guanine(10)-N(2))-dimethyltransferase [Nitrososphaerota archaeon]|nr:tRNA (guanine(10)-N(2))-dimethyltransferase [Nitrososphaerota archaeon]